ncbi:SIMPL domain-containing protein [Salinimonas sediminis]|uniref:SIMPL domain-containing protein n=1 Tax=Salinimonas sediminis TaxID=2303538 RepID=A0A346NPK7_9ALTE|nr:SIMPL domain-containing protein [Salinimonas sediminis]AXR07464.1 SIMPL domain-containing protein [Salinimonas sediminis]
MHKTSAAILAGGFTAGMITLGLLAGRTVIELKAWDRVVTVKGLAEQEVTADTVIWPLTFNVADNDIPALYATLEHQTKTIVDFLTEAGISPTEITTGQPGIIDKLASQYGAGQGVQFRYTGTATVTVYTGKVEQVRAIMGSAGQLINQGIVLAGGYNGQAEYEFTGLNALKPAMVEQATLNARQVAQKFAHDSASQLGKIKQANQGQFSITPRDQQHPHLKKVRVVSTIQYTLVD